MKSKIIFIITFTLSTIVYADNGVMYFKAGFPDVAKPVLLSELKNQTVNKAETCYYLGNCYFFENNTDSAGYYFSEGLKDNPLFYQNNVGLLMLKMKTTDAKVISSSIEKILSEKKNKKDLQLILSIGYSYLHNGISDKAVEYMEMAKELQSKSPLVYVLAGDIDAPQNLGKASTNYELALNCDPKCVEAFIKYARVYKNVNPGLALEKLTQLEAISPDFMLTEREFGDVYYAKNDFTSATKHYENYLNSGNRTTVSDLVRYSMALFMNHNFQKSIEVAEKGISKDAGNPAFKRLKMYNLVDLKKYDDALVAANSFFNESKDATYNYLDYRYYGQALKEKKQFSSAIDQFNKAFQADSSKVEILKDISDMYSEISKYDNAISYYAKYVSLLKKADNQIDQKIALGKLYYKCGTDTLVAADQRTIALNTADSVFSEVVKLKPEDYRGNFWRARVNSAIDPETTKGLAKPFYESTATFAESKNDARYKNILIECYSYLGWYMLVQKDNDSSILYWKKILDIDPNNAVALKGLQNSKVTNK